MEILMVSSTLQILSSIQRKYQRYIQRFIQMRMEMCQLFFLLVAEVYMSSGQYILICCFNIQEVFISLLFNPCFFCGYSVYRILEVISDNDMGNNIMNVSGITAAISDPVSPSEFQEFNSGDTMMLSPSL